MGAWPALWDAVFQFNFAYSDASPRDRIGVVEFFLDLSLPVVLLALVGWCTRPYTAGAQWVTILFSCGDTALGSTCFRQRDAASRYFYEVPLTTPNYTSAAIHEEFLSDLKQGGPKLIVQMTKLKVPPLGSAQRSDWRPFRRFMYDPERFQPIFGFVEENYLLVDQTPFFTIYALRHREYVPPVRPQEQLIARSDYSVYLDGKTITYVKNDCRGNDAVAHFILHVIPVDSSVIGGRAQDTLDFSFLDGKDWYVGDGCEVSRELPDYAIAAIRTGQYNADRTAHKWLEEYRWPQPE